VEKPPIPWKSSNLVLRECRYRCAAVVLGLLHVAGFVVGTHCSWSEYCSLLSSIRHNRLSAENDSSLTANVLRDCGSANKIRVVSGPF